MANGVGVLIKQEELKDHPGKLVKVNTAGDGYEFVDAGVGSGDMLKSTYDPAAKNAQLAALTDLGVDGNLSAEAQDAISKRHADTLDHIQDTDQGLDGGGPSEVSAAQAKAAYDHSVSAHAPSDAQKNSDITQPEIEAKLTGEVSSHTHPGGGGLGYTLHLQALTSSPGDGATVYFGNLPKAPTTSAAISRVYIPKAGTIKVARIWCYSGTAGTNEAWSLYIRKNNAEDTLIATLSLATNARDFSNASLSIAVAAGDYIEIKGVQPAWATNPATTIYGGYVYIE